MGRFVDDHGFELLDYDPAMGRSTWVSVVNGITTYRTDYEVSKIIDANKEDAAECAGAGWKGDYHRIASIPVGVYYDKLLEAGRQDDNKYLSKWLNDSDHSKFRVKEGSV